MKIALASDHAGFEYKEAVKRRLIELQHQVSDFGTNSAEAVDYPVYIRPAAEAAAQGEADRAIVFGGSGNGEAIVANKVRGIRCALCWNIESARLSRQHNDANALSIGQRLLPLPVVLEIVEVWLATPFEAGRHERRIKMIE
jgi:ribose 5-phosphate isomerase B